eukprot:23893-Pelagococcus_subviridis.AAC.3
MKMPASIGASSRAARTEREPGRRARRVDLGGRDARDDGGEARAHARAERVESLHRADDASAAREGFCTAVRVASSLVVGSPRNFPRQARGNERARHDRRRRRRASYCRRAPPPPPPSRHGESQLEAPPRGPVLRRRPRGSRARGRQRGRRRRERGRERRRRRRTRRKVD